MKLLKTRMLKMKNQIDKWLLEFLDDEDFVEVTVENEPEQIHEAILKRWGKNYPGDGCIFITPEGSFINLFPALLDHEDLCAWVEKNGFSEIPDDASWFVKELSYVKCRNSRTLCYAEIPSEITRKQLNALETWLEEKVHADNVEHIDIGTLKNECKTYDLNIYFPEDIIKRVKRFYSSGRLYEAKNN